MENRSILVKITGFVNPALPLGNTLTVSW